MGFKQDLMAKIEVAVDAALAEAFGGNVKVAASKPQAKAAAKKAAGGAFVLSPQSRRIPDFVWKTAGLKSASGAKEKLIQKYGLGASFPRNGKLPPEKK